MTCYRRHRSKFSFFGQSVTVANSGIVPVKDIRDEKPTSSCQCLLCCVLIVLHMIAKYVASIYGRLTVLVPGLVISTYIQ